MAPARRSDWLTDVIFRAGRELKDFRAFGSFNLGKGRKVERGNFVIRTATAREFRIVCELIGRAYTRKYHVGEISGFPDDLFVSEMGGTDPPILAGAVGVLRRKAGNRLPTEHLFGFDVMEIVRTEMVRTIGGSAISDPAQIVEATRLASFLPLLPAEVKMPSRREFKIDGLLEGLLLAIWSYCQSNGVEFALCCAKPTLIRLIQGRLGIQFIPVPSGEVNRSRIAKRYHPYFLEKPSPRPWLLSMSRATPRLQVVALRLASSGQVKFQFNGTRLYDGFTASTDRAVSDPARRPRR